MPMYENGCTSSECPAYKIPIEHFFSSQNAAPPPCEKCGGPSRRMVSQVNVIWGKPMGQYGDKTKERYYADFEGHHVMGKNERTGKPEKIYIDSIQKQREYCKREGLLMPSDVGPVEIHKDGIGTTSNGLPGQWV